jgi:NADPH-dependent ferric siderophore reductase
VLVPIVASKLSSFGEALAQRLFIRGTVREVETVTSRMRRVRIHAPELATLPYEPGQHVRVKVGDLLGLDLLRNDTLRAYSIWRYDRTASWLELCVLDHPGQGPGARWAAAARPGDEVLFRAPEGKLVARGHAGLHVLFGDETAAVAFGALLQALPGAAQVRAFIETEWERERLALERPGDIEWLARGRRPTGDPALLVAAARRCPRSNRDTPRTAYLAGEARTCKAVKQILVDELAWSKQEIVVKPFWMPGSKGLE